MAKRFILICVLIILSANSSLFAGEMTKEYYEAQKRAAILREEYKEKGSISSFLVDFQNRECDCKSNIEICNRLKYLESYVLKYGCRFLTQYSLKRLSEISGHQVFLSGPHTNEHLNLESPNDFGHYNKNFVIWARKNLIPGAHDPIFRELTQDLYNSTISSLARGYFVSYIALNLDTNYKKQLLNCTKIQLDTGRWPKYVERPASLSIIKKIPAEYTALRQGSGFWLRRTVDGTDKEFALCLQLLLQTYDDKYLSTVFDIASEYYLYKVGNNLDKLFNDDLLRKLGKRHLRLLRNGIFATKGYMFKDKQLSDWFDTHLEKFCRSGNCGKLYDSFTEEQLNEVDRQNLIKISELESIPRNLHIENFFE